MGWCYMRPLPAPQSPEKVKLQFHLVTKNTITKDKAEWKLAVADLYKPSLENLQELDYQSSREDTVILIHGMYVSAEWNWSVLTKMAEAYLSRIRDPAVRLLIIHKNRMDEDCSNFYNCAPVGLNTFDYVSSGTFYVHTKLSSPYCLPSLLKLTNSLTKKSEEEVSDEIISHLS